MARRKPAAPPHTLLGVTIKTSVIHPGDLVDGRYRVHSVIADGGMGTVFLAEHAMIGRRVALKVLHPDLASDREMVQRFLNEASAAGTLGHPNIVESTDMGFTSEHVPFIVFEYLEGALLTEEVYRVRGLPVRRALRIAKQIASALDAAHSAGIVHADLKSDNIFLIDKDGHADHVKVLDFGIAKFMEGDSITTQRNVIMGTPEFMSPEQISAPETVDQRTDVWALGVVLYEMLACRRPFGDDEPRILLHRIVYENPPEITRRGLPEELVRLVMDRMLAKDPAERFSTMRDVYEALDAIEHDLRGSGDSVPPPVVTKRSPAPPNLTETEYEAINVIRLPPAPRARWPIGMAVVALLAGMAGGGVMLAEQRMSTSIDDSSLRSLEADAVQLAAGFEASARSVAMRASAVASAPMMRAAIETDAATIADLAQTGSVFSPAPAETLQVFQVRDGRPYSVLRLPQAAAPIAAVPAAGKGTLAYDGTRMQVVASAGIMRPSGDAAGLVALAAPIELAALRTRLGEDALAVTLTGLGAPVELVARTHPEIAGRELTVPVALPPELAAGPVELHAVVRPAAPRGRLLRQVRNAAWGFGAVMLLGFVGIGGMRSSR